MTGEEALAVFQKREFDPLLTGSLAETSAECSACSERLQAQWYESREQVNRRILDGVIPFTPAYAVYTYLRTDLLEKRFHYQVYLYDRSWYFGMTPFEAGTFQPGPVFTKWEELWGQLQMRSKRYVGKVSEADVRNLALSAVQFYSNLFAELAAGFEAGRKREIAGEGLAGSSEIKVYCGELMGQLFEVRR